MPKSASQQRGQIVQFIPDKNFLAVAQKFVKLQDKERFYKVVLLSFEQESQLAAAHIVKSKLSGNPLKRRTGSLARSVIGQAELSNGLPAFRVGVLRGPALRYAGVQEYGATIKPTKAKALAIPGKAALTPAGVDRFGGPRKYPGQLRFLPFRRGVAIGKLVDENAAEAAEDAGGSPYEAEAVYILVREVTIKAKHYLRDGFQEYLPKAVSRTAQLLVTYLEAQDA